MQINFAQTRFTFTPPHLPVGGRSTTAHVRDAGQMEPVRSQMPAPGGRRPGRARARVSIGQQGSIEERQKKWGRATPPRYAMRSIGAVLPKHYWLSPDAIFESCSQMESLAAASACGASLP